MLAKGQAAEFLTRKISGFSGSCDRLCTKVLTSRLSEIEMISSWSIVIWMPRK